MGPCPQDTCEREVQRGRDQVEGDQRVEGELQRLGREDIMVVVGGVIPPGDVQTLLDMGVAAVFPPGTVIAEAAVEVLEKLNARLGYAQTAAA